MSVSEIKQIKMVGVFISTAIFSTWAYIWFFLVLVVITPGQVDVWEACVTLSFMLILCIVAYSCDVCHTKGEDKETRRFQEQRKVAKAGIRIFDRRFGKKVMLEIG